MPPSEFMLKNWGWEIKELKIRLKSSNKLDTKCEGCRGSKERGQDVLMGFNFCDFKELMCNFSEKSHDSLAKCWRFGFDHEYVQNYCKIRNWCTKFEVWL